ncbi:MAG: phosphate butyryltransferase [Bacteroidetes bacterium]|nr:phosphate butyryltransferase [Bacteroidota bacterium]MBU1422267.1 phosphate butyryltransferase [Bacteroidota bacterium]
MTTRMIKNFEEFFNYALTIKGKNVVVVQPNNEETLSAVVDAKNLGLADFHLVGDESLINQTLKKLNGNPADYFIYNIASTEEAIIKSFELIHNKTCHVLMKGSVDTSTLMKAVFDPKNNLRTGNLFSDVFIFEYPQRQENKFVMITDGGLNLQPNLEEKIGLIKNAVRVANALGNNNPKVAILSASEKVNPKLQSSIDAAELKRLNQEGKITGCVVDGPMALDLAISPQSAIEKNYKSEVAGNADIIVAPSIESANSLAKSTQYFANLPHAQVIVGGIVPILIPSRADKREEKLRTIALGVLMSN